MTATEVCPACGGLGERALHATLRQCLTCGLVRTSSVYIYARGAAYDEDYFTERNAYLARADEFTGYFESLLDEVSLLKTSGKLLDVGCGPGLLMAAARQRGFDVCGCDVSAWAIDFALAQGLDARLGALESLRLPAASVEVVVCNHALEHVPEPLALLVEMRRLLAADGLLFVGAPNFDSLMSRLLRRRWGGLLPEQHFWHFTPATLTRLLFRAGLDVQKITFPRTRHHVPQIGRQLAFDAIDHVAAALRMTESMHVFARKRGDEP